MEMDDLVKTAKSLADSTRVRIVAALLERELCVCELCDSLGVTQSTLSTHLQVIRDAGLVSARKEGKWMYYAIQPG
ncbi:MAG: transcriptional regulator, partial [Acidobacteria bacterium]